MREDIPKNLRILSLDGGAARCMSQLEILREFMYRLNFNSEINRRPCDYFHWIGGVGAGGVIATLLVTLKMTVDEAALAFTQIRASVLEDGQYSPAERASQLETVMKSLLVEHRLSFETKLADSANPPTCKLGLFYIPIVNQGRCALFRNYESRQASYNPTVIQAVRAVWAIPNLFSSIYIGPELVQEEIISVASGFYNPTLEILKEAHQVFGPDATVSCLLSLASSGTPATNDSEQLTMDCEKTADEVLRRIGRLGVYFRFSADHGLEFNGLDGCIHSSEKDSRVTLEQLYHARTKSPTSLRGLPPLTAFFIMRNEPMSTLTKILVNSTSGEQHVVVLAGMGGSGKTQLTLKFARDFEESFQLIIFIDASSVDTIKKGLLARIRTLGSNYNPETVEDALEILANPEDVTIRNWLIIYDNADDPELDLRAYIPACDNGSVLITTRNTTLRHMSPDGYIELDVMSPEEAVAALLQAAIPAGVNPAIRDRQAAAAIAQRLGYLPLAIIQAGCYIRQQQCMYEYEDRLNANRKGTLERPARNQRDTLKYGHSVYAALDITLEALSPEALHTLNLLSSVHFTNFPRPLISVAAKVGFRLEVIELLDRPASFQAAIDFLTKLFCPSGTWDENMLVSTLEELQQYSLVSLVPSTSVVTLRLHPLVHSWAQDRMSLEEQAIHRAAAVRVLACGADRHNGTLYDYITPHIMSLSNVWNTLHVNDRVAFLRILDEDSDNGDAALILERSQGIYEEVRSAVGEGAVTALRAKLFLAGAYGSIEDVATMERMEMEVVNALEALLGREDLDTIEAMINLAGTYTTQERYNDAEVLLDEVLKVRTEKLGEGHIETALAMEMMARVYKIQKRYVEAQKLFEIAVATRTRLCGRADLSTLVTTMHLADALDGQSRHTEANVLRQEALTLENTHLGTLHIGTLWTTIWMGHAYALQERFEEAENLLEQALAGLKEVQGPQHPETLDVMALLAGIYEKQDRFSDSIALRKEELAGRRDVQGDRAVKTLDVLQTLAFSYMKQESFQEMLEVAKELVESKVAVLGELHADTIVAYSLLGHAYQHLSRYQEAEDVRRHEVDIRKQCLGENHSGTFAAIGALGRVVYEQGRIDEAEQLWREEVEGRKRALEGRVDGPLLDAINQLSVLAHTQKRFDEMEVTARVVYEGRRKLLGGDHRDTLGAAQWLGRAYLEQRNFAEAENILAKLLAEQMESLGDDDIDTLNTISWIGRTKYDQRSWTEAEAIWLKLHQKRKEIQGEKHIDTILMLEGLGTCAYEQGRISDAAILREQDVTTKLEVLGLKDTTVYDAMGRLALIYQEVGQLDAAESVARQMLEKSEVNLGHQHPITTWSSTMVAFILYSKGQLSEAADLLEQVLKERDTTWGETHAMVVRSRTILGHVYEAMGRHEEATALAEEAAHDRLKNPAPDSIALMETPDPMKPLNSSQTPGVKNYIGIPIAVQPVGAPSSTPVTPRPRVRVDSIDIDGYSSPGDDPQSSIARTHGIARPPSPFEERKRFGRAPNSWSMFM